MASPRVFISSTFYDLRHVREDLERSVRELGYRESDGLVLHDTNGSLTQNQVRSCLWPVARKAGVRHGVHILRHTFCSHLAMQGMNPRIIQGVAGHENLTTTERYMHFAPGHAAQAFALLDSPSTAQSESSNRRATASA